MPRFSICQKSRQRLQISVIIFCEIAEHIESPGAGGNSTYDPSIHRDPLSPRGAYSIHSTRSSLLCEQFHQQFYRCAISAINFPRHRCQLSRLRFSTYKPRARVLVDICNFFFRANENFSRFPLDSIGKEGRHPLANIIDYAILGRERKREPFFVTVPVDKLYFSNDIHFFFKRFCCHFKNLFQ